jgi:GAF domain-containing protein
VIVIEGTAPVTDIQPMDPIDAAAQLGGVTLGESGAEPALAKIAELTRRTIPGAHDVSVTLLHDTGAHSAAFTGQLALELDEWQYEHGYGPCLDASRAHEVYSVPDMSTETRWPEWAARALGAGAHSSLSIGLPSRDRVTGALNLYGTEPDAFDEEAITVARVFADYAAVVLADDHHHEVRRSLTRHLRTAMERRAVVEQAKGIIMGDRHCTAAEATAILEQLSRYTNRSPSDIAAALVGRAAGSR